MGYKKSVFRSLAMVTQLGLCVLTPILFGIFAGSYMDSHFGTKTILVFLILGTLGGGRGAYLMAKRLIEQTAEASVSKPKVKSRVLTQRESIDTMASGEEQE